MIAIIVLSAIGIVIEMGEHLINDGSPNFKTTTAAILIIATWELSSGWGIGVLVALIVLAFIFAGVKNKV